MGLILNAGVATAAAVLTLLLLAVTCYLFWTSRNNGRGRVAMATLSLIFTVLVGAFFWYTSTHRIVGVNERAIVINKWEGELTGGTRDSGVTSLPFLAGQMITFPADRRHEECHEFTPSAQGGYELKTRVCFYFEANNVDWTNQFNRYNKRSYESLTNVWWNQLAPKVALATKDFIPSQLTNDRDKVMAAIKKNTEGWFKEEEITLLDVVLANWDFTDPKVRDSYNQTILAQNQQVIETARSQALDQKRKNDLFEVDTANQVLDRRATGVAGYLKSLGLTEQSAIVQAMMIVYLQGLPNPPANFIFSNGAVSPNAAVPVAPPAGR